MLEEERLQRMRQMLQQNRSLAIEPTAALLQVSSMTVRRDLAKLIAENPSIKKCHGGAILVADVRLEDGFEGKLGRNVQAKRQIAQIALSLVHAGDFIYIDAGTTTYELAHLLRESGLEATVMTNDIAIAHCLKDSRLSVVVTGGMMQRSTGCLLGNFAEQVLERVRPNLAFMGATSIDEGFDVSTPTIEKAFMKQKVVSRSQKSYLLADAEKFYKHSAYEIYNLSAFTGVITDKTFAENERREINRLGIHLLPADGRPGFAGR